MVLNSFLERHWVSFAVKKLNNNYDNNKNGSLFIFIHEASNERENSCVNWGVVFIQEKHIQIKLIPFSKYKEM